MATEKTEFGTAIDIFLKRKRWKRRNLAEGANISEEALSRILTGKVRPSADICHKFGRTLELGPSDYQYIHTLAARLNGFAV